jgi:hypothetical protein
MIVKIQQKTSIKYKKNYDNDIILGDNGIKYLNDMLLQVENIRKLCDFNILVKPKMWNNDTCKSANIDWL